MFSLIITPSSTSKSLCPSLSLHQPQSRQTIGSRKKGPIGEGRRPSPSDAIADKPAETPRVPLRSHGGVLRTAEPDRLPQAGQPLLHVPLLQEVNDADVVTVLWTVHDVKRVLTILEQSAPGAAEDFLSQRVWEAEANRGKLHQRPV